MSNKQTAGVGGAQIDEGEVASYLREHPNFFETHLDLLADIKLPHDSGGAVSLIERQVQTLREQKAHLDRKLSNLIQIARDNDKLNNRTQKLTLALMEGDDLEETLFTLHDLLRSEFDADAVVLRLFAENEREVDGGNVAFLRRDDPALRVFEKFFASRRPICGHLVEEQSGYLFGDKANEIASAALIPVCDKECFGLLAIGSRDARRYHHAMGTLFLAYIGEMLGRALRRLL